MMQMTQEFDVAVLGSINLDISARVPHLTASGETVTSGEWAEAIGGKGANQAAAACRAGVTTAMFGALGDDGAGIRLRERLEGIGVRCQSIRTVDGASSGTAFVTVDPHGENAIVVGPGANAHVDSAYVDEQWQAILRAKVLVLQGELSAGVAEHALMAANGTNLRPIFNLAPYRETDGSWRHADPLVLNETEATQLSSTRVDSVEAAQEVAVALAGLARSVVITLGAEGAVVAVDGQVEHVPAPRASRVVDTTGAGDAFVGVLAACLATGWALRDAVRAGVCAASASVAFSGAADAYPDFRPFLDVRAEP